jgi:hypothetical protein
MSTNFTYFFDGIAHRLQMSSDQLVVRTHKMSDGRRRAVLLPNEAEPITQRLIDAPLQGVAVFQLAGEHPEALRDALKQTYQNQNEIAFAGRAVQHPSTHQPVIYTENIFLRFKSKLSLNAQRAFFKVRGLKVKRKLEFAEGAYFIAPTPGIGTEIFALSTELFENEQVALCHPELLWAKGEKAIHPKQWHLTETLAFGSALDAHAHVKAAHAISTGKGVTIAIIDDGVDTSHAEFSAFGKCVHPFDFATNIPDARPKKAHHAHGTNCAGVACASGVEASGVAPDARLMPLVIPDFIGSVAEAQASRPNDPLHTTRHPIPDMTRLAIEFAATQGRNGKGCVITWAAGNGNESVDLDGYASQAHVMAIGACNERSTRTVYSDFGSAISCCFPSGDYNTPGKPTLLTKGLYVADRAGFAGISAGAYTDAFTGTSAACPGVAGLAALILSLCPSLTATQVRSCIEQTCVKIDTEHGQYDTNGKSNFYGFGRVHAIDALVFAQSMAQSEPDFDLRVMRIRPTPPKGEPELIELKNMSTQKIGISLVFMCNNRKEVIDVQLKTNEQKTYILKKLRLPNSRGSVRVFDKSGTKRLEFAWKKAELDRNGWKRF